MVKHREWQQWCVPEHYQDPPQKGKKNPYNSSYFINVPVSLPLYLQPHISEKWNLSISINITVNSSWLSLSFLPFYPRQYRISQYSHYLTLLPVLARSKSFVPPPHFWYLCLSVDNELQNCVLGWGYIFWLRSDREQWQKWLWSEYKLRMGNGKWTST